MRERAVLARNRHWIKWHFISNQFVLVEKVCDDNDCRAAFPLYKDIMIKTSAFDQMDTDIKDPGTVLIDRDGVRVFGKYVGDGSRPTPYVILYGENKSGVPKKIECSQFICNDAAELVSSNAVLEDGNKTIYILPVNVEQPVEKIEVALRVSDPNQMGSNYETFQIPVS